MLQVHNSVQLVGRLIAAPSLSFLSDGTALANLRLILPEEDQGLTNGEGGKVFHLVAYGKIGMALNQRCQQNTRLLVRGGLRNRSLKKGDIHYYRTEIIVREYLLISFSKKKLPTDESH